MDLTPQEKSKDKRLWKCYRWTLAMYKELGKAQNWRCAACGREAKNMPLNVDHYHFKITSRRAVPGELSYNPGTKWYAFTEIGDRGFSGGGRTKIEAMANVREQALPHSVRGLLCAGRYAGCNRKLGRIDDPVWLRSILAYLEDPPAHKILGDPSQTSITGD